MSLRGKTLARALATRGLSAFRICLPSAAVWPESGRARRDGACRGRLWLTRAIVAGSLFCARNVGRQDGRESFVQPISGGCSDGTTSALACRFVAQTLDFGRCILGPSLFNYVKLTTEALSRIEFVLAASTILVGLGLWTRTVFNEARRHAQTKVCAAALAMEELARSSLMTIDGVLEAVVSRIAEQDFAKLASGVRFKRQMAPFWIRRRLVSRSPPLPSCSATWMSEPGQSWRPTRRQPTPSFTARSLTSPPTPHFP
jgi:hypothetical protein